MRLVLPFKNRQEAGSLLGQALAPLHLKDAVVLGLPRGGVVVAREVAERLDAPLDILVVRKIGHPLQPEYGIGAISEEEFHWLDPEATRANNIPQETLERTLRREANEVRRRAELYRDGHPPISLKGRTAILVDDGLATGVTARAAAYEARGREAKRVVLAVPVASGQSIRELEAEGIFDAVITLAQPEPFYSVGEFYEDFTQVEDSEVLRVLNEYPRILDIDIPEGAVSLPGTLVIPKNARGLVVFAHGSGSSRHSPRNRQVARALVRAGFATLLFDLLVPSEETPNRERVFDIEFLAQRLAVATRWVHSFPECTQLPIGYFGASTGAAAAISAAAMPGSRVSAIVSRGGRVDLSPVVRDRRRAGVPPVLLLVGGEDEVVLELNRWALTRLAHADLKVISGATHLFDEPGALEQVTQEAIDFFADHLKVEAVIHRPAA